MRIKPEHEAKTLRKIWRRYLASRKKSPYFCDRFTCLSKAGADSHMELLKSTLESAKDVGDIEAFDIIRCELFGAVQAYTHGTTTRAVEKLFDCIAAILRTVDVIEGRQTLGKPITKQSNKKGTKQWALSLK